MNSNGSSLTVQANGRGHKSASVKVAEKPQLSADDQRRLEIARGVIAGEIEIERAGAMIGKSQRQMRRIVERVKREGDAGVVHKLRGRASNRRLPTEIKNAVLRVYTKSCKNLGLSAAKNRIWREARIRINRETLRRWLVAAGLRLKREEMRRPAATGLVFFGASYLSK